MKIYAKDVAPLGFKGNGMFDDSKWHQFYYATLPKQCKVYIISSLDPDQSISHFSLSQSQYKEFKNGKLSLVPIGCCCASGGKYIENPIIDFRGDFQNVFGTKDKFLKFVKKLLRR